jgi:hypothetical protein
MGLLALGAMCREANAAEPATQTRNAPMPSRLIVDIDVNDEVLSRPHVMTEQDVKDLLVNLHAKGCDTVLVRMGFLGLLPYRTKLSYPVRFDEEHARRKAVDQPYFKDAAAIDAFVAQDKPWCERYAKVIEAFDPPAAFVKYGHEIGLKVIIWLDIFDDGFPGFRSKFLDEHPQCQWTGRDGTTRYEGLMSYAWPEARAFRVAQAKELLDLGADGIHCSTSAHARHLRNVHEIDYYGYEQPVVDEFRKRHGVDILTAKDFDREAWHDIKGEMMDKLYRDLAEACHQRGKELWIGMQIGRHTNMSSDSYFGDNVVARYANHWKLLVDEGVADTFILGDYEFMRRGKSIPYWQAKKDIVPAEGEDLFGWAAREYKPYCAGKTKLILFGEWLPGDPKELDGVLAEWSERVIKHGFAGIDLHEALNLESPERLAVLERFSRRLKGIDPGPF